jgi:hypothetical protein
MKRILSVFAFTTISINLSIAQEQKPVNDLAKNNTVQISHTIESPFGEAGTENYVYADGKYNTGTGTADEPDTYSYGLLNNDDRAFGSLTGADLANVKIGAKFLNNTGEPITSLLIEYTGEQWRCGLSGEAGKLLFAYSTDAVEFLNSGTWTNIPDLDFISPQTSSTGTGIDGNETSNRTKISYTLTGLSIPNGSTFWIRWENTSLLSKTHGLAIDDFLLTPFTTPAFTANYEEKKLDFTISTSMDKNISLNIYSPNKENAVLRIVDINGRQILLENIYLEKGYNTMNLSKPVKGINIIVLSSGSSLVKKKFIN